VRQILRWALVPGAALALACHDRSPSEDLRNDLALLDASPIELAPLVGENALVISAAEKVNVPGPKATPSPTRKRAPKAPPPKMAGSAASVDETVIAPEIVSVSPSDAPSAVEDPAPESAPAVRPQPIEPRYPVGAGTVYGSGRDRGTGSGGIGGIVIGVVIRGGRTGRDPCLPGERRGTGTTNGRRGRQPTIGILINDRIPAGTTFPQR
jgi:hypothetical protein